MCSSILQVKNVFPIPDDQSLCIPGIPTVCDVALALYSKLLPDRVQGAGQVTTVDSLLESLGMQTTVYVYLEKASQASLIVMPVL